MRVEGQGSDGIYMCAAFKPPPSIFCAAEAEEATVLAAGRAAASRRIRGKDEGFNGSGAGRDNMTAVKEWAVDSVLLDCEGEGCLSDWPTVCSNA